MKISREVLIAAAESEKLCSLVKTLRPFLVFFLDPPPPGDRFVYADLRSGINAAREIYSLPYLATVHLLLLGEGAKDRPIPYLPPLIPRIASRRNNAFPRAARFTATIFRSIHRSGFVKATAAC